MLLSRLDKGTLCRAARGERLSLREPSLDGRGKSRCFRIDDVKEEVRDAASKAGAEGSECGL